MAATRQEAIQSLRYQVEIDKAAVGQIVDERANVNEERRQWIKARARAKQKKEKGNN